MRADIYRTREFFEGGWITTESSLSDAEWFVKHWYNNNGQLHRVSGPAVIVSHCRKEWWLNGLRHREDGPAVDDPFNHRWQWFYHGQLHREDGPAWIYEGSPARSKYYLFGVHVPAAQFTPEYIHQVKLIRIVET